MSGFRATPASLAPRLATAGCLIAALGLVLWLDARWLLALLFGVAVTAAAREWARLCAWRAAVAGWAYPAGMAMLCLVSLRMTETVTLLVMTSAGVFWVGVGCYLITRVEPPGDGPRDAVRWGAAGVLALWPAWLGLLWLRDRDPVLLVTLFLLVWTADTSAYFGGRAWGQVRLAPAISPGKTRAGAWSALAGCALAGGLLVLLPARLPQSSLFGVGCGLVVAVAAIVGDLFESLLKRRAGAKDSGHLLPGHGGILDRVDSLLAAAPVYALLQMSSAPSP